jgi:hypothetical protein
MLQPSLMLPPAGGPILRTISCGTSARRLDTLSVPDNPRAGHGRSARCLLLSREDSMTFVDRVRRRLRHRDLLANSSAAAKASQLLLVQEWRRSPVPRFNDAELRAYSQNGEDGLLLYLFARLGTTNRTTVEICAGDGVQCNSANLILNHGWQGILFDGDRASIDAGCAFYAQHPDSFSFPPRFVHAWIDRETINGKLAAAGCPSDPDLLSIDLDGVDWWIWDVLEIHPRVVCVETQCIWGADRSVTVPYARDFRSPLVQGFGIYSGASLPAFVKLGRKKGYRLVGTQALGFNAFFVRGDLDGGLPEVTAAECLDRPFVRWASAKFLPMVQDKEWKEV